MGEGCHWQTVLGLVQQVPRGHAQNGKSIHLILPTSKCRKIEDVKQHSSKVLTFLSSPLLDNTDPTSMSSWSFHLLFQTLTSVYQLHNKTFPGTLENASWLSLLSGASNCHLWLHFINSPLVTPVNSWTKYHQPPCLAYVFLFSIADCFNSSGTHWAH